MNKEIMVEVGTSADSNTPLTIPLNDIKNLLIAGNTGMGGEELLLGVLCSLLSQTKRNKTEIKVLSHPQYNFYFNNINKCECINSDYIKALKDLMFTAEFRNTIIARAGCSDFNDYNQNNTRKPLKRIIVVIPELYQLMHTDAQTVTEYISRINRLVDIAGIHILASTTRWFFITLNDKLLNSFNSTAALKAHELHPFFRKNRVKEKYKSLLKTNGKGREIINITIASPEEYKNRL